jgi:hypothetical protein
MYVCQASFCVGRGLAIDGSSIKGVLPNIRANKIPKAGKLEGLLASVHGETREEETNLVINTYYKIFTSSIICLHSLISIFLKNP